MRNELLLSVKLRQWSYGTAGVNTPRIMPDLEVSASGKKTQSNVEYNYDEAVELTGHGCYNYLLLAACSVITNGVALDMFGFSVVVTAATCDLKLGLTETGILASVPFAGIIFAFPWGYYADTKGRQRALLLSSAVGFTMAALSSLSSSWQIMLALKLIGCCFSTAAFTITMTYLGECTGSRRRSEFLLIMNSANLAAELIFFSLAYFLLPLKFNYPITALSITFRPWRLYTIVLAAPLGIGALMMLFLRESPKFLASRGETDKALEVLRAMYVCNGGKKEEYPVKALVVNDTEDPNTSFWKSIAAQTVPLFKPPLLWRTLQLFYLMALCCNVNNIFLMWYPMIVNLFFKSLAGSTGSEDSSFCEKVVANISTSAHTEDHICNDTISPNTIYSGMILGVVFVTLNLSAAIVARWRRLLLIFLYLVATICLILVEILREPVATLVVFTLVQCTAIGIGCVASYFVDMFPTSCRGLAMSLGAMVARLTALGGVNIIGLTIVKYCSVTFYSCAGYVISGIVLALFLPKDKKAEPVKSSVT